MTEAEKGILGCVLIDSNSMYDVYETLKPEMFASDFARDCYSEMLAMYDNGDRINIVELSQLLEGRKYDSDEISKELKDCMLATPSSTLIKSYANTVVREYKASMAKNVFERISFAPKDIDNSIAEILTTFEALEQNKRVRSKTYKQIAKEYKGKYFNENVGEGLIKTGLYKLDDCLGGLEGGDVTVFAGRPGTGKSAITTQIIEYNAKKGKKVGYFNLEMSDKQIYERNVSRISKLSLTRVRRAKSFLGDEKEKFDKANEILDNYDNVSVHTGSTKISEIRAECRHQRYELIIIDYLQLVKSEKSYGNRSSEVGEISKSIKSFAMELNVPIILLSQLNRSSEYRDTKEPTMADLRESGDIEQDASNIVLIWNLSDTFREYKGMKVDKCRMGEPMKEGMKFNGDNMDFQEAYDTLEHLIAHVKDREKGSDFTDTDDSPFPSE